LERKEENVLNYIAAKGMTFFCLMIFTYGYEFMIIYFEYTCHYLIKISLLKIINKGDKYVRCYSVNTLILKQNIL